MKLYSAKQKPVLSGKGFFTILILCALIVSGSLYAIYESVQQRRAAAAEAAAGALFAPVQEITPAEDTPVSTEVPVPVPEEPTTPASSAPPETVTVYAPVFVRPVSGAVITPFSGDTLLYQPTLGDWRVHSGTDFAAEAGETVLALTDGTVQAVRDDPLSGTSVTIAHDADLETVTSGLEQACVQEGQSISAGEAIGTCAESLPAEESLGPHVHLEARRGGTAVNVLEILGEPTEE